MTFKYNLIYLNPNFLRSQKFESDKNLPGLETGQGRRIVCTDIEEEREQRK